MPPVLVRSVDLHLSDRVWPGRPGLLLQPRPDMGRRPEPSRAANRAMPRGHSRRWSAVRFGLLALATVHLVRGRQRRRHREARRELRRQRLADEDIDYHLPRAERDRRRLRLRLLGDAVHLVRGCGGRRDPYRRGKMRKPGGRELARVEHDRGRCVQCTAGRWKRRRHRRRGGCRKRRCGRGQRAMTCHRIPSTRVGKGARDRGEAGSRRQRHRGEHPAARSSMSTSEGREHHGA